MNKKFKDIFVGIDLIGVIAPEEESAQFAKNYEEVFGLSDEEIIDSPVAHHPNSTYYGKPEVPGPGVHTITFSGMTPQFECQSPIDGNSSWNDFLKKYGKGVHHIRYDVTSHEEAVAYLAERGIPVIHSGDSVRDGGVKFAFYDSIEKLGFMIETINLTEIENKNAKNKK